MGNLWSSKKASSGTDTHRRIYVGTVPEIEEDGPGPGWSGRRRTTRDSLSSTSFRRQAQEASDPEVKTTVRRTSTLSREKRRLRKDGRGIEAAKRKAKEPKFPSNYIKTSRYTVWTFLPKNLLEQFRRFVNFYFLCITALQYLIDSPESPVSSTIGFLFVICVTAVKQGYEDWLRHRADDAVNNLEVHIVVDGKLQKAKSKDLKVGHIVKLENEDPVPADVLVLSSSDDFHRCQITTANLDGETNLKMRYCPSGLPKLKEAADFLKLNAVMECEQPNAELYSFNGNLLTLQDKAIESIQPNSPTGITSSESNSKPKYSNAHRKCKSDGSSSQSSGGSLTARLRRTLRNSLHSKTSDENDLNTSAVSKFLQVPISMENVILRGTKVKNTDYVYGLIVYTGEDTRLAKNSKKTSSKFATIDRSINSFLFLVMGFLVFSITLYTGLHFLYLSKDYIDDETAWYLPDKPQTTVKYFFEILFSFLVLFYYIIPLSLYVTIEIQTFFGSMFFVWDNEMKCPNTGAAPLCNTSDLNEELGQIEYLFSDKTGTLTENVMQFQCCSVDGQRFDYEQHLQQLISQNNAVTVDLNLPDSNKVKRFLIALALCHTVQVLPVAARKQSLNAEKTSSKGMLSKITGSSTSLFSGTRNDTFRDQGSGFNGEDWEFQASSPDEKALLEACHHLGVKFLSDKEDVLTVDICGSIETFKRHFVLEFDSDRKCMSVIVEDAKGDIWLLSKGAESALLPRSISGEIQKSYDHVDDFAQMGLRTLAVTERKLDRKELDQFTVELNATRRLVKDREEKMRKLYHSIESELHVLGATGVEDQLQDGVRETLEALGEAGIRVWMLTGDKVETAVNVAIACGLLNTNSKKIMVTGFKSAERVTEHLQNIKANSLADDHSTFVIDGESLALAHNFCRDLLCSVLMSAFRVVCCRMAPLQKAQVVTMVKSTPGNPITAAVGDGANDVAMIQEAHIGLGILGKEGRQAARCADFALARFSFLKRAILVHGHWYYVRLSTLVLYFFYKNIVFILPPAYSCFNSGFSTQSLFNAFFMTFYNIFFTSAPILAYALQEQPVSEERLMREPQLYRKLTRNSMLTWYKFMWWVITAFFHSVLCYLIPYFVLHNLRGCSDWYTFGVFIVCSVVVVVNVMLLSRTKHMTGWTLFSHCFSYLTFFGMSSVFLEADLTALLIDPGQLRHTFYTLHAEILFWLAMLLIAILTLMPDIGLKYFRLTLEHRRERRS